MDKKIADIFQTSTMPQVMGILNLTPDSFYDGGKYFGTDNYLPQVEKMFDEGASMIDLGAYSSRPGAKNISEEEEGNRLFPVLANVKKCFPQSIISIDTFRVGIAKRAIEEGADIINDISAGTFDLQMFDFISKKNIPYIFMHMQGSPQNMQQKPVYNDVAMEVFLYLEQKKNELSNAGAQFVMADPGFGFGKTVEHNYELLHQLELFKKLDVPLLVGFSRKSMISKLLETEVAETLNGTTVLNTIALLKGAKVLRVHDVKEAVQAVKLVKQLTINSYN
jgi:dihydropteroate synthase